MLLTYIDLSSFKTSKAETMDLMFIGCSSLETINFGDNLDTRNVKDMGAMFAYCSSLKTINFGDNFYTSNVTNRYRMFTNCSSLETLYLSFFNTTVLVNAEICSKIARI